MRVATIYHNNEISVINDEFVIASSGSFTVYTYCIHFDTDGDIETEILFGIVVENLFKR